ncbi:MAG: hypothetical protein HFH24_13745 [Ruminococcus sp.]|nr:hypothetical protein [Ruminococcus sp.]
MSKTKRKKLCLAGLLIGVMFLLSGCTAFDACTYTQAVLDVSYKNQTEDYMEITGASQEEADEIFQRNLDTTMQDFKSMELSGELEENYRKLFEEIIKQVNYTVGEAVKEENGDFTVDVEIKPVLLFDDTYEEFQKKSEEYAASITSDVMEGAEMPSDEEIQAKVYQIYYEVLQAGLEAGPHFGETEKVTVHIQKTEDGVYEIPSEDLKTLDASMISQEKLADL